MRTITERNKNQFILTFDGLATSIDNLNFNYKQDSCVNNEPC